MGKEFGWTAYSSSVTIQPDTVSTASTAPTAPIAPPAPEFADVGRLLRRAVRGAVTVARAEQRPAALGALVSAHLGQDTSDLGVVTEQWAGYDHVNVGGAVDAWLAGGGRSHELIGVIGYHHRQFGLADVLDPATAEPFGPRPGRASQVNLPCGPEGAVRPVHQCALYLVADGPHRAALLLRGPEPESGRATCTVEIVSTDTAHRDRAAGDIRRLAIERNVYRGRVLSFDADVFGHGRTFMTFHRRPALRREQVIIPDDVLAAVQRQVVDVGRHREKLLAAGQHLKRGVLLYGPPGVGKTHTVRYLVGLLEGTTVIQLTGAGLHLISEACSVARTLQPAMIVVEDVDLIAEDRQSYGDHSLLFQLLNEMDGLGEDVDVVFLLTTNRADLLEPALAARPGRVDQAVALELPDLDARRRLFRLYGAGMSVDTSGLDDVLQRTEGVTASFLKELLRRCAVIAAERGTEGPLHLTAADLTAALDELLDSRNAMTRALLGGSGNGATR